jgi:hypothetical protein
MRCVAMGITSTGSGKRPSIHQLGLVGNADKLARLRGHDLLARERRAAALDHVALAVDLVGTVDVDRQRLHLVRVKHRDADGAQPFGGWPESWTPRPGSVSLTVASASMNLLTVEPVPTPTISPGTT